MLWDTVIGQDRVKRLLVRVIEQHRLPHAFLFYGAEGVGKDAMAIELARVLNCERQGTEACGVCLSCRQMASLQHPYVKLVFALPVGKNEGAGDPPLDSLSNDEVKLIQEQLLLKGKDPYHKIAIPRATTIKINSIRDIRREVSYKSSSRGRKVVIISDADNMNDESSNALLKTLEEPPGEKLLVLTTSWKDNVLPTIVSRCQPVRFDPLSDADIHKALMERQMVGSQEAYLTARLANGSYTRAVQLLETDLNQKRKEMVEFLRLALSSQVLKLTSKIEDLLLTADRAKVEQMLSVLLLWFRDAFVLREGGEGGLVNIDQVDDLRRFNKNFPDADIQSAVAAVERAIDMVGKNVNLNLIFLALVMRLRHVVGT